MAENMKSIRFDCNLALSSWQKLYWSPKWYYYNI